MDVMELRRVLMAQVSGGGLPSAYQEVAWIGSTAGVGQYIDTGVSVTDSVSLVAKWMFNGVTAWEAPFGGKGTMFCIQRAAGGGNLNIQSFGATTGNVYSLTTGELIESELSPTQYKINGTSGNCSKGSYDYGGTIWILAKQSLNTLAVDTKGSCRIYYMKIYKGDTIIRDFIPCIRKSDGAAGMYDLVNNMFYANNGAGIIEIP